MSWKYFQYAPVPLSRTSHYFPKKKNQIKYVCVCGHNGWESLPSFCNGLGTIYVASSQGKTIGLTTKNIGLKLRYGLEKVLGTQNCPTLKLTSSHCILCLNPIKGTLNIVILNSHTHTNIHLTINMASNIPNHTSIMLVITSQTLTYI